LMIDVDKSLNSYDPTNAGRSIQEFIDNLSNWYVRRSRRRFWKSENDSDKLDAYNTLYTCLAQISKLMAPLAPFVSEELYQKLVKNTYPESPDSVHLSDFPTADLSLIDEDLMKAIRLAMKVSSLGRSVRSRAGLKVRQPLADVLVQTKNSEESKYLSVVADQILEELNVKNLGNSLDNKEMFEDIKNQLNDSKTANSNGYVAVEDNAYIVAINTEVSEELKNEGLIREIAHRIQGFRKDAGFEINDRIMLYVKLSKDMEIVLDSYADFIKEETLSNTIVINDVTDYDHAVEINGDELLFKVVKL